MHFAIIAIATVVSGVLAAPSPTPFCLRPMQPCWKVKRAVDAFSLASTRSTDDTDGGSLARYATAALDELTSIAADATTKAGELDRRGQDAATFLQTRELWCLQKDENSLAVCWKDGAGKKAAEEQHSEEKRWCMGRVQPCWKARRAAESILQARGDETDEDDASSPCEADGNICWKAKRDLAALHEVARSILEVF